ncbi:serine hydrolase domain-containing protein [Rhodococcus sp. NPDC127530]|uniref:serine hydrolase domain-containing protein n=1 Tax=unclassified Rhodococcus (in: high G+C Gram-positive bacteria) TaxID=192944 RepID=UPI003643A868
MLDDAVEQQDVPFVVAMVANSEGTVWQGQSGYANPSHRAGPRTVFKLLSMTKAIGSLAAMILVDRGTLTLDTEVASVLPEFDELRVLESIGVGSPEFRPARRRATLRHLLTHTSGLSTKTFDRKHRMWEETTGAPNVHTGTLASMRYPLMFDPGEGFTYGIGIDWVGLLVERIDGRPIDQFCRHEIFGPLEMHDTCFELNPRDQLADLRIRTAHEDFADCAFASPISNPEVYSMGHAVFSTAPDYLRFLRMILGKGELDGRRVISARSVHEMTTNQIGDMSVPVLESTSRDVSADVEFFPGTRKTFTAGFMRTETDVPTMRRAGSLSWAGAANTHFWIDPVSDLAAVFMTQTFPFCEPRFMDRYAAFERAVYRLFAPEWS